MSGLFSQNDGIAILGKRGVGKSSIVKFLIKILSNPEYNFRFTILDIVGNMNEFKNKTNVDYYLVDPNDKEGVNMVMDAVLKEGNRTVVLDEADRYRHYETSKLSELVNIGRNYNTGYICTARRTANIPKDFIVNANWIVIFKHTWPEDIDRITEWLNVSDETIRGLKQYEFLLVHDTEIIGKYKLNLPKGFTVESTTEGKPQPDDLGSDESQLDSDEGDMNQEPTELPTEKPKEERWP